MADSRCGPHTELANNGSVRITRCACGTVHLTVVPTGVTMRISQEHFRNIAAAMRAATEKLDAPPVLGSTCVN